MSFAVLRSDVDVAVSLGRCLRIDASQSSGNRFEIVRWAVWSRAGPAGKVHVNRVLGEALPTWRALSGEASTSDENFRAELREVLSLLQETGDLIEQRGGYWSPATARVVQLSEASGYLLIGGVPSAMLPLDPRLIQYHGPHRHFTQLPHLLAVHLPMEELASWARLPQESSLQEWAQETLKSVERQTYTPTEMGRFQFYRPERARFGAPQFRRWVEDSEGATCTLLARRTRAYGARENRLVDVRNGEIVRIGSLEGLDIRRLMYAFDLAATNPVRVRRLREDSSSVWVLSSELPRAEQRLFGAFGTLSIPEDRPFERRWQFARNELQAIEMLRSLGIAFA